MSTASTIASTTATITATKSPIWQNPDIGPDSSFVFVNASYDLGSHLEALKECLAQVELSTGCKSSVHGQWIKVKGQTSAARRKAFSLINSFTDNSCKEISLPSLDEVSVAASDSARLATPSPPSSPEPAKSTALPPPPQRKGGLTRSSTETLISSLQQHKSKSPFSSVLLPLQTSPPKNSVISEEAAADVTDPALVEAPEMNIDVNNNSENGNGDERKRKRHKYSVDFLLLRSDVPNSKKLPSSWKALNEKFPGICFCGKVLSYFNPYKYHEHWEKTKHTNYELHDSGNPFSYAPYPPAKKASGSGGGGGCLEAHTDDFINVNRSGFSSNGHNGSHGGGNKFYRTNPHSEYSFQKSTSFFNYPAGGNGSGKKFEARPNQALPASHSFYQQENQHSQQNRPLPHRHHKGQKFQHNPHFFD